jgi:hypothetical protein
MHGLAIEGDTSVIALALVTRAPFDHMAVLTGRSDSRNFTPARCSVNQSFNQSTVFNFKQKCVIATTYKCIHMSDRVFNSLVDSLMYSQARIWNQHIFLINNI